MFASVFSPMGFSDAAPYSERFRRRQRNCEGKKKDVAVFKK